MGAPASDRRALGSMADAAEGRVLDGPLLTVSDVARLLAVKPGWVYHAVREGEFPYVKVGRHLRFVRGDLERWVRHHRTT